MIFKTIIFILFISLAVRFVLRFLLPVSQMARITQQRLNDIKNKMDAVNNQTKEHHKPETKRIEEDYIDYEEIK